MLTAPKTGKETRKMIKELAEETKEKMEDYIDQVKVIATAYFEEGKDFIEKEKDIITKTVDANNKDAFIAGAKTRQWDREKSVRTLA